MLKCSTSLWSADLADLAAEIRRVEPYSERFHLDVADGHYVPNLLFFPDLVRALRKHTAIPFEVHLMVTDPPYGVEYDPTWRNEAGVSFSPRTGRVSNDDRADWRDAWQLFPGEVAYVWHAGIYASTVAGSLVACGFGIRSQIIWMKPRLVLSRGHYHWQHEPCWYAVREGATGHWQGARGPRDAGRNDQGQALPDAGHPHAVPGGGAGRQMKRLVAANGAGRCATGRPHHYTTSNSPAAPMPPPTHMVTTT